MGMAIGLNVQHPTAAEKETPPWPETLPPVAYPTCRFILRELQDTGSWRAMYFVCTTRYGYIRMPNVQQLRRRKRHHDRKPLPPPAGYERRCPAPSTPARAWRSSASPTPSTVGMHRRTAGTCHIPVYRLIFASFCWGEFSLLLICGPLGFCCNPYNVVWVFIWCVRMLIFFFFFFFP